MKQQATSSITRNNSVVIRSSFFDKNHKSRDWVTSNVVTENKAINAKDKSQFRSQMDYAGRTTEVEIVKVNADKTKGYLAYTNQSFKVTSSGHFDDKREYTNQQFEDEADNKDVPDKSMVWSQVISFKKEYQEDNQIFSKEKAAKIIRSAMPRFFAENNLDHKSMKWFGQFHVDTPHHFHVHLRIHQKYPSTWNREKYKYEWREKGKFKQSSFENMKKNIDLFLQRDKMKREFVGFNARRDDVKWHVLNNLENPQILKSLITDLLILKKSSHKGRMSYSSRRKTPHVASLMDRVVGKLIHFDPTTRKKWMELNKFVDDKVKTYTTRVKENYKDENVGWTIKHLKQIGKNKTFEAWEHLANQMLKFVKGTSTEELIKIVKELDKITAKKVIKSNMRTKNFTNAKSTNTDTTELARFLRKNNAKNNAIIKSISNPNTFIKLMGKIHREIKREVDGLNKLYLKSASEIKAKEEASLNER